MISFTRSRAAVFVAATLSIALSTLAVSAGRWELGVCVVYVAAFVVATLSVSQGKVVTASDAKGYLLIFWFALTPIASFFIRFPVDKSVVSFDRLMIGGLGLMLVVDEFAPFLRFLQQGLATAGSASEQVKSKGASPWIGSRRGITATKFELCFALLAAIAVASVGTRSMHIASSLRIAIDAMVLPLIAFRLARRWLNRDWQLRLVVFSAIFLSIFLVVTGGYEFFTGFNLFPYKGSQLLREGELRVNGPFVADTSFALISLLLAVFLLGAPRILTRLGSRSRLVAALGALPAIVAAFLPLFRAVAVTLAICWAMMLMLNGRKRQAKPVSEVGSERGKGIGYAGNRAFPLPSGGVVNIRPVLIAGVLLAVFLGVAVAVGGVSTIARLTSARNILGRLVSQQVAVKIWMSHPVLGVGLGNYTDYFARQYVGGRSYLETLLDTHVANTTHSNILWVASELGAVGLIFYLLANVYLFTLGWHAFRRPANRKARAAAVCYLAVLASYWIMGLALNTGFYWDINLYYFFTLGMLSAHFGGRDTPDSENLEGLRYNQGAGALA